MSVPALGATRQPLLPPVGLRGLQAGTGVRGSAPTPAFGPAVRVTLSERGGASSSRLGAEPQQETLPDFKDVAADTKQAIADAVRRLKAASAGSSEATESAKAALERELAELVDIVAEQVRASEGADLFIASIGADAVAFPLVDIRV